MRTSTENNIYTVKGLKTFTGMEGQGFNASLCRNGKKVAFVIDSAQGGDIEFQWLDDSSILGQHLRYGGEIVSYRMTLEELYWNEEIIHLFDGNKEMCEDIYICRLIESFETVKKVKRAVKTKTWVADETCKKGEYMVWKYPFTDKLKAHLDKVYPEGYTVITPENCGVML